MDGNNAANMAGHGSQPPPVALHSSVSLTALPASSVNSTATHPTGYSRTSYRRDCVGLRSYSSLQDFSSYRVFPATASDASAYQDSGDSLEKAASPFQVLKGSGAPFRVGRGGFGKSGAATGGLSPLILPPSAGASWCSRGYILVLLSLFLCALFFLAYQGNFYTVRKEQLHFAVVIDCGSTGTRVHVYGWARPLTAGKETLPVMLRPEADENQQKQGRAYRRMETEPGLHQLTRNESGIKAALEPLLDWAGKRVPVSVHASTPIFVLATAGLRRLPPVESKWVLDKVWSVLETSSFLCRRKWVRIISGVEEASYGWIALNYNQDRLGHAPDLPTFGALDLGGSSLEVTFEPQEHPEGHDAVNLSVGSVEHRLYAHSHEGFGLNDAFQKSIAILLRTWKTKSKDVPSDLERPIEVKHPCLHSGYLKTYMAPSRYLSTAVWNEEPDMALGNPNERVNPIHISLVGDPNWERCADLAAQVLNSSRFIDPPRGCDKSSCTPGKPQPEPRGKFYALSGFFVVYKFFGLHPDSSLKELLQKARQYCAMPWEEALISVEPQTNIEQYCFRAPYVVALLSTGLHLSDEQIVIDSGGFAWTLGAALLEAGALDSSSQGDPRSLERQLEVPLVLDLFSVKGLVFLVLLVTILVVFVASVCPRSWIIWQRRRSFLPIFTHSPNSQIGCLPKSLGAIFSSSAGGEGRMKLPGSPAPVSPTQSFQQDHHHGLALESHSSIETDLLQITDTAGSASTASCVGRLRYPMKLPHKGGSRLQSRRTQSREDLNLNDLDGHISKV